VPDPAIEAHATRSLRPRQYRPPADAALALADGRVFRGRSFGARTGGVGEAVFTTTMVGYQEVCTDPSFRGQIVCMTYPLIGNYGVNDDDDESRQPWVAGLDRAGGMRRSEPCAIDPERSTGTCGGTASPGSRASIHGR
jgi:hypothetical protein